MDHQTIIKKRTYHDSVTLMSLAGKLKKQDGVEEVIVSMATPMNKELLENVGLMTEEASTATDADLIIACRAEADVLPSILAEVDEALGAKKTATKRNGKTSVTTFGAALDMSPDANLAVISVPGEFAARETRRALEQGLHVMLFSDNVSVEDERDLKTYAAEKGLFVMGPDCGTAMINGTGLCFANDVKRGGIGMVAASGTGLQEVMVQVDRLGYGVSQAIGTGGRDLSSAIGGIMMRQGIDALLADESTDVLVVISKPPAPEVEQMILERVARATKPVVLCLLDGKAPADLPKHVTFTTTLFEAALAAARTYDSNLEVELVSDEALTWSRVVHRTQGTERFIRGLFCGGTLTAEALSILRYRVSPLTSNVAKRTEEKMPDIFMSAGHTLVDLGDDAFTVGKPHPMIEPALRNGRILQEAADPTCGVLLLDFELGYGSHDDPVGETLETLKAAQDIAKRDGRILPIVTYICGTETDKQGYADQKHRLEQIGAYVARSNAEAVEIACTIVKKGVEIHG
ncbi:acyl-CoA synthetase FdrA [Exiguobacterium sp. s142]|uniref:acyl-CoA synthetase FdrA n=1 Tax=Exiguobacterium sp. s142 TaxID=2751222 RepID=UPI001BEAE54F|nr:acyl-CoA synthetase FdrA [Exiguobacterium sp. s142]